MPLSLAIRAKQHSREQSTLLRRIERTPTGAGVHAWKCDLGHWSRVRPDLEVTMSAGRFNANLPLDAQTRRRVADLRRNNPEASKHFERVRHEQLRDHPPADSADHTPAQRANATEMANKAVAMRFLGWP
jgi:hypothetical protein